MVLNYFWIAGLKTCHALITSKLLIYTIQQTNIWDRYWDGWPSLGWYTTLVCNQANYSRSTQPCIPPGSLNQVSALIGWGKWWGMLQTVIPSYFTFTLQWWLSGDKREFRTVLCSIFTLCRTVVHNDRHTHMSSFYSCWFRFILWWRFWINSNNKLWMSSVHTLEA